jgi:hypothetical protein
MLLYALSNFWYFLLNYLSLLNNGCAGLKHVGVILKTFCVLPTNVYILVFNLCDILYCSIKLIFRYLNSYLHEYELVLYTFIIFLSIEFFSLSLTLLPISVLVFHDIFFAFWYTLHACHFTSSFLLHSTLSTKEKLSE